MFQVELGCRWASNLMQVAFTLLTYRKAERLFQINLGELLYLGEFIAASLLHYELLSDSIEAKNLSFTHEDKELFIGIWIGKIKTCDSITAVSRDNRMRDRDLFGDCALECVPEANHVIDGACH